MEEVQDKKYRVEMTQWIVSLAVSVVCCSVLFLIFAGYIMDLHNNSSLARVQLNVIQERLNRLTVEIESLRDAQMAVQKMGEVQNPVMPDLTGVVQIGTTAPKVDPVDAVDAKKLVPSMPKPEPVEAPSLVLPSEAP